MTVEDAAVITGGVSGYKSLRDGTVRIQIDVAPSMARDALNMVADLDVMVAVARLTDAAARRQMQSEMQGGEKSEAPPKAFGQQAKALRCSGFFLNRDVWRAVGSDEQYMAWVRRQPSVVTGKYGELDQRTGEQSNVAAHVNLFGDRGTGFKTPYAAVPLTPDEHHAQHQHGYGHFHPLEWWRDKRIETVFRWCWDKLKSDLGYDSWASVPPAALLAWAEQHGVSQHLPEAYK